MTREVDAIRALLSTTGIRESRHDADYEVWVVRKSVIAMLEGSIGAEKVSASESVGAMTDENILRVCTCGAAGELGSGNPWPHVHIGIALMEIIKSENELAAKPTVPSNSPQTKEETRG